MKNIILVIFLMVSATAFGQDKSRFDLIASTTQGHGTLVPMVAIPGAKIDFYASCTSLPCPTRATTYTDIAGSGTCSVSAQVTPSTGGACTNVADSQGNFGAWMDSGSYSYTVTVNGSVSGPYPITVQSSTGVVGGYVKTNPTSTQTVTQPTGTSLNTNVLNGFKYANGYGSIASADTLANDNVVVDPSYTGTDSVESATNGWQYFMANVPTPSTISEFNMGKNFKFIHNGVQFNSLYDANRSNVGNFYGCLYDTPSGVSPFMTSECNWLNEKDFGMGGYNGNTWRQSHLLRLDKESHSGGISQGILENLTNYNVSDGGNYIYIQNHGSGQAVNDELVTGIAIQQLESKTVPNGITLQTPSGGTSGTGLTDVIAVGTTSNNIGTFGVDRFIMPTTPTPTAVYATPGAMVSWTQTIASDVSVTASTAVGTLTVPIPQTVATPAGYSFTASLSIVSGTFNTSSPVCISGGNFDYALVTSAGSVSSGTQSVTMTIHKPQTTAVSSVYAEVYQGGTCGQGVIRSFGKDWATLSASSAIGSQYIIPVAGSRDTTSIQVWAGLRGGQNGSNPFMTTTSNVQSPPVDGTRSIRVLGRSSNVIYFSYNGGYNSLVELLTSSTTNTPSASYAITGAATADLNVTTGAGTITSSNSGLCASVTQGCYQFANTGTDETVSNTATMTITGINGLFMGSVARILSVSPQYASGSSVAVPLSLYPNTLSFDSSTVVASTNYFESGAEALKASASRYTPYDNFLYSPGNITGIGQYTSLLEVTDGNPAANWFYGKRGIHQGANGILFTGNMLKHFYAANAPLPGGVSYDVGCPLNTSGATDCTLPNSQYIFMRAQGQGGGYYETFNPVTSSLTTVVSNVTTKFTTSSGEIDNGTISRGVWNLQFRSGTSTTSTPDTNVSRCTTAVICIGNGTQGDFSGQIKSYSAVFGTDNQTIVATNGTITTTTPTAGDATTKVATTSFVGTAITNYNTSVASDYGWVQPPSTATDTCTRNQKAHDDGYLYVCVENNTWTRVALSTW